MFFECATREVSPNFKHEDGSKRWPYWGAGFMERKGLGMGVATNETKTNYVQAVNYQTLEHRLGSGRDVKQK